MNPTILGTNHEILFHLLSYNDRKEVTNLYTQSQNEHEKIM
jgi:hypothetical protein